MADSWVTLNQGSGGSAMDAEAVTYGSVPTERLRERLQVTGALAAEVARVLNAAPASNDYGLVTRVVGGALEATMQSILTELGQKTEPANTQATSKAGPGTGTSTSVAASASSVQLLAANTSRRSAIIWNDSATATLYVKYGTTATTSSGVPVAPGAVLTIIPEDAPYTGRIDGIWSAAIGNARITELT